MKLYRIPLAAIALLLVAPCVLAQYNAKGRFHASIGMSIGAHGTEVENRYTLLGFTVSDKQTDGAATVTVPIELDYALGQRFTLGLLIEPGRYVPDTADGNQSNGLAIVAIQPRYYLINGDRLAWTASLQLGAAALRIQDDTPGAVVDARFSGSAFGIGTGLRFGLGDHVGLGFDLRYLGTNMELRAAEVNGTSVTDSYAATLRTGGVLAQLSLAFRFGGE